MWIFFAVFGGLLFVNGAVAFLIWRHRPRRTKLVGRTQWLEEIARAEDPPQDNVLRPVFVGKEARRLFGKETCQPGSKGAKSLK